MKILVISTLYLYCSISARFGPVDPVEKIKVYDYRMDEGPESDCKCYHDPLC